MFNWIKALFKKNPDSYIAITLSKEELYEVKRALRISIKRDQEIAPVLASAHPHLKEEDGVLDRAKHSTNVLCNVLMKMQG